MYEPKQKSQANTLFRNVFYIVNDSNARFLQNTGK